MPTGNVTKMNVLLREREREMIVKKGEGGWGDEGRGVGRAIYLSMSRKGCKNFLPLKALISLYGEVGKRRKRKEEKGEQTRILKMERKKNPLYRVECWKQQVWESWCQKYWGLWFCALIRPTGPLLPSLLHSFACLVSVLVACLLLFVCTVCFYSSHG